MKTKKYTGKLIYIYQIKANIHQFLYSWQNILKLVSWVLMRIWMVKQLVSTGFCIQIIKRQKCPKLAIVKARDNQKWAPISIVLKEL